MFYLDSAPRFSSNYVASLDTYFKNWNTFLKNRVYMKNDWDLVTFENIEHQNDSYNCGVFVCYFFNIIIQSENHHQARYLINRRITFNIDEYRQIIKETVIRNSSVINLNQRMMNTI